MAKLPHMPLWVYDLEADEDCALMSLSEYGAYMKLLQRQWIEGSIPNDTTRLARLLRVTNDEMNQLWSALSPKFTEDSEGRLFNPRLDDERDKALAKVERNRANGKRGGRPPKTERLTSRLSDTKPNGLIRAYDSDSVSDSSLSEEGECREGEDLPARVFTRHDWPQNRVAEIYNAYPVQRRGGHVRAYQAIRDALSRIQRDHGLDVPDAMDYLAERVRLFAASDKVKSGYYLKFANWLDEGGYDEPAEAWADKGGAMNEVDERLKRLQAAGRKDDG